MVAVRMLGSIVIAAADPSFVHKCASDSITCQRFELWADVGESEVAKRRGSGAGWPGRVGGRWNEGVGRHRIPEDSAAAVRMLGSIVIAAADPSFVHKCASDSITCQRFELWADVGESEVAKRRGSGAGWPGRVGGRWNEGVGRLIVPEAPVVFF